MKRLVLCLTLLGLTATSAAWAQEPADTPAAPAPPNWADVTNTPSEQMWFYIQEMRRYDDPQQAVRRNAEYRAAQRRTRIATMKWLGYSKQRPTVSVTPLTYRYGQTWIGHPTYLVERATLYQWVGGGAPTSTADAGQTIRR